jgi:hypothetical protein
LFRDKRSRLNLVDIETMAKTTMLNYSTFVQWIPGSDVVIAQSRDNMCVWYNIDAPERVTMVPIKGDIVDVVREDGKTEVIVQGSVAKNGQKFRLPNTHTQTKSGCIKFLTDEKYLRQNKFTDI